MNSSRFNLQMTSQGSNINSLNLSNSSIDGDFERDHISIAFPLKKFVKIRTSGVDCREIDQTIRQILLQQRTSRAQAIIFTIILSIIGIGIAYLFLIFWIICFFSPPFLFLQIVLLVKYFIWQVKSIKMRILKKQKRKVIAFLESQNKRFYFRKLIKWKLDNTSNKIILQNLRG